MSLFDRVKKYLKSQAATRVRTKIACQYLHGDGLEIGALHNPLKVPRAAHVKYVDRISVDELRQHYPELRRQKLVDVDIIADGESLNTIPDASQDFVIANHFIEHCQNPLLAIKNILRVLKHRGILYLAVPDKRFTFDVDRPVTVLEHLLRDLREGPAWSRTAHFEEWVRYVIKVSKDDEVAPLVKQLTDMDYSIHFHCWTQREMFELLYHIQQEMPFDIEMLLKNGEENIFVLRTTD